MTAINQEGNDLLTEDYVKKFHHIMMLLHQRATNESPIHVTAEHHVYHL